jgi:hypothetical protein
MLPPAVDGGWPFRGAQVITTILKNLTKGLPGLNLNSKAKIKNNWSAPQSGLEGEGTVIFRNSEHLCGVLDKNQTGSTEYGLIHSVYEVRLAHAPGGRKLARLAQSWPKGQVCPVQGLCVVCVCVCVCVCVGGWCGVCVLCVCVCVLRF